MNDLLVKKVLTISIKRHDVASTLYKRHVHAGEGAQRKHKINSSKRDFMLYASNRCPGQRAHSPDLIHEKRLV